MWARRPQPGRACDADADSTVSSPCGAGRAGVALATARERGSRLRVVWSRRGEWRGFSVRVARGSGVGSRRAPAKPHAHLGSMWEIPTYRESYTLLLYDVDFYALRVFASSRLRTPVEKATRSVGFTSRSRFTYTVHGAVRLTRQSPSLPVYTRTQLPTAPARAPTRSSLRARRGARADRETADVPCPASRVPRRVGQGRARHIPCRCHSWLLSTFETRTDAARLPSVSAALPPRRALCSGLFRWRTHGSSVTSIAFHISIGREESISQRTIDALATRPISHAVPHTSTHKTH